MKTFKFFVLTSIFLGSFMSAVSSAGSLNLTILNQESEFPVVKYIARYGYTEKTNPEDYPYVTEIVPDKPVVEKFHGQVKVIGNGVGVFMSVKDVYIDPKTGATVETDWSESSFELVIPDKVNLRLK